MVPHQLRHQVVEIRQLGIRIDVTMHALAVLTADDRRRIFEILVEGGAADPDQVPVWSHCRCLCILSERRRRQHSQNNRY
jgi:hypothetical protein